MYSAHTITWHIVGRHRTDCIIYLLTCLMSMWMQGPFSGLSYGVVCGTWPPHSHLYPDTKVHPAHGSLSLQPVNTKLSREVLIYSMRKGVFKWNASMGNHSFRISEREMRSSSVYTKTMHSTDMGASLYLVMGLPDPFGSSDSEPPGLTPSSLISLQFSPSTLLAYLCHTDWNVSSTGSVPESLLGLALDHSCSSIGTGNTSLYRLWLSD